MTMLQTSTSIFRQALGCAILLVFLPLLVHGQTPETATASPAAAQTQASPSVDEIEARRKQLAQRRTETLKALDQTKADGAEALAALLEKEVETLQQLDSIYVQQSSALQSGMALAAELRQYQDGLEKLAGSAPTESITFGELDLAREELNGQATRKSPLEARLQQSRVLLEQSREEAKEQRDALSDLKAAKEDDDLAKERLALAQERVELAEETLRLREIEEANNKLALSALSGQTNLLERRVSLRERQATFGEEELKNRIEEIETEEFAVQRELGKSNEQQTNSTARLFEARERLDKAPVDQQAALGEEVEAKRLADELVKVKINALTRRLDWLSDWKIVWQRRHAVFNQLQTQSVWLKWKQEATDELDAINQDQRLIALWLNDWQKQLITVKEKLAKTTENGETALRWVELQRQNVEKIIDAYRDQQAFLEKNRRLQLKLIDQITDRTAHRTWREWLRLVLDYELHGNRVQSWVWSGGSVIGLLALFLFVRNFLVKRLQVHAEADEALAKALFFASVRRTTIFFLLMISVFLSALWLSLEPSTSAAIKRLTLIALIFQGAIWFSYFFGSWVRYYLGGRAKRDAASKGALSILKFTSQAAVWSIALMLVLQNLGIDVTALATGLGIGGVAVALALQRILGDLFSSLSIVLDKPFLAGDFIVVDQVLGTVEHIGIKTTRIRSLDGEQIICANSDLLETRIRNFHRMKERRVAFQIGVVYQTTAEQLASVPAILREIVSAQAQTRFDRAHFKSFGDFALIFEVVYFIIGSDYTLYMDIQQAINLALFERFQQEGIDFAYPTQSLYVQGSMQPAAAAERTNPVEGIDPPVEILV